jgi:hypothetical protein
MLPSRLGITKYLFLASPRGMMPFSVKKDDDMSAGPEKNTPCHRGFIIRGGW